MTGRRHPVALRRRALKDLRRIGPGREATRIHTALEGLATGDENLDVKAVSGRPGWLRLRVGDWRIAYIATDEGWLVERIVHRSQLERAISSL